MCLKEIQYFPTWNLQVGLILVELVHVADPEAFQREPLSAGFALEVLAAALALYREVRVVMEKLLLASNYTPIRGPV